MTYLSSVRRYAPFFVVATLAMTLVSYFLSVLGILGLHASGGAGRDTALVVGVAACAVTDFWGGGLVKSRTNLSLRDGSLAWAAVRSVWIVTTAVFAAGLWVIVPIQIVLAAVACGLGMRVARMQQLAVGRGTTAQHQALATSSAPTTSTSGDV